MRYQNIRGTPVCKVRCKTCPFSPGGDLETRMMVESRVLSEASQTCHSTGAVHGKQDTYLCRGARDFQLQIFHRLGFLSEPTDEAWDQKLKGINK